MRRLDLDQRVWWRSKSYCAPSSRILAWLGNRFLEVMIAISVRLVRRLQGLLPFSARHAASRSALLAQLSARPSHEVVLRKLQSFAATRVFDDAVRELANGSLETGSDAGLAAAMIGWEWPSCLLLPAPGLLGTTRLSQFTARLVRELRPLFTAPTPGGRLGGSFHCRNR